MAVCEEGKRAEIRGPTSGEGRRSRRMNGRTVVVRKRLKHRYVKIMAAAFPGMSGWILTNSLVGPT